MQETELQMRLRRAKEALEYARNIEYDAIRALASARESVRAAKERYEDLFTENEKGQCARIKRGELRASGYDPSMD